MIGFPAFTVGYVTATSNSQRVQIEQAETQVRALSDHRWCATLDLLTAIPVPIPANPAANPSRVEQYRLYEDFLALRTQFGCPK